MHIILEYTFSMKPEEIADFTDTASSQFYTPKQRPTLRTKIQSQTYTLDTLEEQIAKIKQTLLSGNQLLKRIDSNEQLQSYVQETKQELKVVRARNITQQNSVKSSFQQNFSSLQRELGSIKNNWANLKKKAEAQIEEEIESFKQKIKQDQVHLSKTLKNTSAAIKNKSNLVLQEMRDTKKHRNESTSLLMKQIEQARVKFDCIVQSERKKRNEYEQIVLGLLDRTVEQGQKLLRRIC